MANTSLSLGKHWETFIKSEVSSGRYGSASEVIREALRNMEDRKSRLNALKSHLFVGENQAKSGDFVENFSMNNLISNLDND